MPYNRPVIKRSPSPYGKSYDIIIKYGHKIWKVIIFFIYSKRVIKKILDKKNPNDKIELNNNYVWCFYDIIAHIVEFHKLLFLLVKVLHHQLMCPSFNLLYLLSV